MIPYRVIKPDPRHPSSDSPGKTLRSVPGRRKLFPLLSRPPEMCYSPEMASCWILNCRLIVGFSSGLEAPTWRPIVPFRLGSFCGFIFPTSQDSILEGNIKKVGFPPHNAVVSSSELRATTSGRPSASHTISHF